MYIINLYITYTLKLFYGHVMLQWNEQFINKMYDLIKYLHKEFYN